MIVNMDIDDYWGLISTARLSAGPGASTDDVATRLEALLVEQGMAAIRDADAQFMTLAARACGWPLWGAAYLINGGCSDDGFDYFLGWLIGQGRQVFERTLHDPDSLADVVAAEDEGDIESEDFYGVALSAAHRLTVRYESGAEHVPRPELGDDWDFDDEAEMRARYPRLADIFLD